MLSVGETRVIRIPRQQRDAVNEWCDNLECVVQYWDAYSGLYVVKVDSGTTFFMAEDWLHEKQPETLRSPPTPVALDDWRAWAEDKPGYCACGIMRAQCDYHR